MSDINFKLMQHPIFGISKNRETSIIHLSTVKNVSTYKYLCPDVYPFSITCIAFKNIFMKFERNRDVNQKLYFKFNHHEGFYYFKEDEGDSIQLLNSDFDIICPYFMNKHTEESMTWTDILIFDAKIGTYQFKRYNKDGYTYVMIHLVYMTDGITDLITITNKEEDSHQSIDYIISLMFKAGKFIIFNEYTKNNIISTYISALNEQIEIINYLVNSLMSAYYIKRDITLKLYVKININKSTNKQDTIESFLKIKYYQNNVMDDKGYIFNEANFYLDNNEDDFLKSDFFVEVINSINIKYNNTFNIENKYNFINTLKLLEMINL